MRRRAHKGDHSVEIAKMRLQVNQILHAVKTVVPQEMWNAIADQLDQVEQRPEALDVETEDFDDHAYGPTAFIDDDDEF
jgi:hypothetical protein